MGFSPPPPLFFLLLLTTATFLPLSTSKTFPADTTALRHLKDAIDPSSIPPGSCLASWDFSSAAADPCDSLFSATLFTCGFRCDANSDGLARVTDISLDAAGYSGSLSPAFWSLPFLQSIDIPDNHLSGPIPSSPGPSLPNLRRMTLSRNAFSGDIPAISAASLPSLEELFLDGNQLTGTVPTNLAEFRTLKRLELQMNNLTGELPSNLGSLQSLYFLDASDNTISGAIPVTLPPSLVELAMRNNLLEGELPSAIRDLGYLQVVDLSNNRLSGSVLAALFSHPSLEQLVLSGNQLTSLAMPPSWGSSSGLLELDLSHNELNGMLPGWLSAMPRLSALSLEGNRFTGMIPWGYAAKPFARLLLAGNYLYGPIPSPLTAMKEGSAVVSLADNCLFRCPEVFFFCQGGEQKPMDACRAFNPFIP